MTRLTRSSCRRRTGTVVPKAENFGYSITADHQGLSKESESRDNHRYAVVVPYLATQWIQSYPCKQKLLRKRRRAYKKFLESTRKPKVIYTNNSLEFGESCEELSWNHCTFTRYRSETNGIAGRAVRRVKERTPAVLLQSGLDRKVGGFHGMLLLSASDGKTPCERRFGTVWSNGGTSPYFCGTPIVNASVRQQSLARHIPRLCLVCGWNLERETLWSQTFKDWSRWRRLNSTPEGSMQRKC